MDINTKEHNINELFSINRQYFIDFYQRDYQWRKEHIAKLLEDLFYRFSLEYKPSHDASEETVSKYDWYYLNAYVTNEYNGNIFVVDGQQRLTSLALILIKLFHLANHYTLDELCEFIKEHISGMSLNGRKFWMGHNTRKDVLEDLFKNGEQTRGDLPDNDVSISNLYKNYAIIDKELDSFLKDNHKFRAFTIYFLQKVMLVRIHINNTKDVPMVFEVINDRGERLKPYEVLKGKLLGQIPKSEIESYHSTWQRHIHNIQGIDEKEVDNFFRYYFRSKYVDTHAEYREYDGEYHKTIYETKWDEKIQLKQNTHGVKEFVSDKLNYFADVYVRILKDSKREDTKISPSLLFNDLNDQDRQLLLILSSCKINDPDELRKIKLVSRLFDKHFTFLQITGSYDNNKFTESLIELNKNIREKECEEIEQIYNDQIIKDISEAKGVQVETPFEWNYFKDASNHNLGIRFIRYYFARIEHFIADHCNKSAENYYNLVRNTGTVYGHHVEHIIADNEENRRLFNDDEELFYSERNKLGALLLLKGRDNQSSGNETYSKKLKTYSGTLLWNQTLCSDFYHSNKDFEDFMKKYNLNFKPFDVFDSNAVLERQKLLFELTKLIWQ
ncbi:MAG: DUF262 domain-containing protein [Candidatus Scalindua sp.]